MNATQLLMEEEEEKEEEAKDEEKQQISNRTFRSSSFQHTIGSK